MLVLKVLSSGIEGLRDHHVAGADPRQHGVGVGESAVVRLWDELVSLGNEQDGERHCGPELHKHIARIIPVAPLTISFDCFWVLAPGRVTERNLCGCPAPARQTGDAAWSVA